jgi:hypothetical protein
MLYAPKNEDVCENIEHKKHEYREEIYAGEEGRPKRMCGPWKCCSPPKEVARSPPDDSDLPNARGPESVGGSASSCEESQTGVTALVENKLGALQKP